MQTDPLVANGHITFESAAQHACTEVPISDPGQRAVDVRQELVGQPFVSATHIVVCKQQKFLGVVTIEDLLAAPGDKTLGELMDRGAPFVAPGVDQEVAAWHAVRNGESALAVVDERGKFAGLIPPHRLLAVLLSEHLRTYRALAASPRTLQRRARPARSRFSAASGTVSPGSWWVSQARCWRRTSSAGSRTNFATELYWRSSFLGSSIWRMPWHPDGDRRRSRVVRRRHHPADGWARTAGRTGDWPGSRRRCWSARLVALGRCGCGHLCWGVCIRRVFHGHRGGHAATLGIGCFRRRSGVRQRSAGHGHTGSVIHLDLLRDRHDHCALRRYGRSVLRVLLVKLEGQFQPRAKGHNLAVFNL